MRQYEFFYAEESIRQLPEYGWIANRYRDLQWIENYQTFRRQDMAHEKKCLIFARKRGAWLKPFHCYDNRAYQFLSLDLAEGCLFDCVYCYLQSYLNHGALVLFLGEETLLSELSELPAGQYWISTGLLSDSLLVESQFSYLPAISRRIPAGSVLELRSKATCLDALVNDEIIRDPVVISWSLNPPEIVRDYEYGTSSLDARIEAAWLAIRLGYRIAFHLDPIFYFPDWKEAYRRLFDRLDSFPKDRIAFLSLGLFRYMPDLGNVIRKRFPYNPILADEFFIDEDGKYHYFRPIREMMCKTLVEWLRSWSGIPVFWSMEPEESFVTSGKP
jgi:spore photoproduct lyase